MTIARHRVPDVAVAISIVLGAAFAVRADAGDAPRVLRVDPLGDTTWTTVWSENGSGGTPLESPEWFPVLPVNSLLAADAERAKPAAMRGTIALLDFWASWCAPCLDELPHLQVVHERLVERGLRVVAVNVDDPAPTMLETSGRLGLTMELARPTDALRAIAKPRSLPTLLLVDREGRVRQRWDGYRPGLEQDVERAVRALLDDPGPPPPAEVATVHRGDSAYTVRWSREVGSAVDGVCVDRRNGVPRVIAAAGREVLAFDPEGRQAGRAPMAEGTGRIVAADLTGDGHDDLAFWRPGSPTIRVLDLEHRATASWDADGPVFDVAVLPPDAPAGRSNLTLATPGGVRIHTAEGRLLATVDAPARGVAVAVWNGLDRPSPAYVTADGTVVRIAPDGSVASTVASRAAADRIVPVAGDVVLIPGATVGWTDVGSDPHAIAAFREDGSLIVFDVNTGAMRWSATWPDGIGQVVAGDLDEDGIPEIVVATGKRVVVLEAGPREVDAQDRSRSDAVIGRR